LDGKKLMDKPLSVAMIEDTPVGPLVAAASENGIVYMSFCELKDFHGLISNVRNFVGGKSLIYVQDAIHQVQEYFNRQRRVFDLPLDLSGLSEFRSRVLREAQRIPYGKVTSYGELAQRIGQPQAGRAVGGALAHNPIVLVIPCHRVIDSSGQMHGFSSPGGINTKADLLRLEGCHVENGRLV